MACQEPEEYRYLVFLTLNTDKTYLHNEHRNGIMDDDFELMNLVEEARKTVTSVMIRFADTR